MIWSRRIPKVLQVGKYYPPFKGGMETHLRDLSIALRQHVEVQVLVASSCRRTVREAVDEIHVTRAGTLLTIASTPVCPSMVRELARTTADVVHVHLPHPAAVLAWFAAGGRNWRRPLVATYHSDIIRQRLLGAAIYPLIQHFLWQCRAIIVTSPNYVESSRTLRAHRARCRVVPHGIRAARFRSADPTETLAIRARYGNRIILAVGRLVYYKGFEVLVRAMAQVDGRAIILGTGPLHRRLEKEVRRLHLDDRVHLLGELSRVEPYFAAADVFALPSVERSEAFGIVQLEAMAAGLPVVNTRLDTGVPFVSLHGVTGLTVSPGDAPALAGAISQLLGDPALRAQLGAAGRRRVEADFTVERMAERTLAVYEEILLQLRTNLGPRKVCWAGHDE